MISVVCVYNDREVLESRLLESLARQCAPHEFVGVDNCDSRFRGAAAALNHGAARARGGWLLFAHQDVSLLSAGWLGDCERILEASDGGGWSGVAGLTDAGRYVGILRDRAAVWGEPLDGPREVQTLDECLLVRRREGGPYFDEGVPGWHAYGVEACCAALRDGARNYVLPLPVWHDSKATNLQGLEEAHAYVWRKHGAALRRIHTTCGTLPTHYGWGGSSRRELPARLGRRLFAARYELAGHARAFRRDFLAALEVLTEAEGFIEFLHRPAPLEPIEAAAVLPQSARRRRVLHRFDGWGGAAPEAECAVIAPDLARGLAGRLEDLRALRGRVRRLILCVEFAEARAARGLWPELRSRASEVLLTRHYDATPVAVLDLERW